MCRALVISSLALAACGTAHPPEKLDEAEWVCGGVHRDPPQPGRLAQGGAPILQRAFVSRGGLQLEGEIPTEVPVLYSIPIHLRAPPEVAEAWVRWTRDGVEAGWPTVREKVSAGDVRLTIPCVDGPSAIGLYLVLLDAHGDVVDSIGDRKEPIRVAIVEQMRSALPEGSTRCGRELKSSPP